MYNNPQIKMEPNFVTSYIEAYIQEHGLTSISELRKG